MITIGIDNGQSGSIAIIGNGDPVFVPTPTQESLHYGKRGTITQRLDRLSLKNLLDDVPRPARVVMERPFSNPKCLNAMLSAHRFFEATIIVLEDNGLGPEVFDSGPWQKAILGDVKGSKELKQASRLRGIQLYPALKDAITKHGDADGLLMAHHYHYGK